MQRVRDRSSSVSSKVDGGPRSLPYYDLYRRFRRLVLDDDDFESEQALGQHILTSLVTEPIEQSPVLGGRLYVVDEADLVLVAKEGEAGSAPIGLRIPTSYALVQEVFDNGYLVADSSDQRLDPVIEDQVGGAPFAAIVIGPEHNVAIGLTLDKSVSCEHLEPAIATLYFLAVACWRGRALSATLRQAAEIQTSLLEATSSSIEGFEIAIAQRPSDIVGGDFYDITELTSGTCAVTIGDATGHGLAAALQARDAVVGLRMGLEQQLEAVATISRLDRVLARSAAGRFASLCHLELDTEGHFIYVNAGHPPPLIIDPLSGSTRELVPTGTVLGLPALGPRHYRRRFEQLEPNEILIAYTDGVVEVMDSAEDEFGVARLVEVCMSSHRCPLRTMKERLFAAVDGHARGSRQIDDQTVLLLRRTAATH